MALALLVRGISKLVHSWIGNIRVILVEVLGVVMALIMGSGVKTNLKNFPAKFIYQVIPRGAVER